jgi:hypothetical protein
MKRLFALMLCLIVTPACATTQGKKLVLYECNCRDTAFYRQHIKEMEKIPFDGVVISVLKLKDPDPPDMLGWNTLIRQRFQQKDYQHAIDDLKAVKSKHFTDNFIQVIAQMGLDWFDPDWPNMAYNASCMARVAKQGRCKGLMLDAEQYDSLKMWTYATLPAKLKSAHTFAEYQQKARERGREVIQAVNKEFPDITLLMLFGPSLTHMAQGDAKLEDSAYSLLAAFCDGVCEAATPKTTLVDGYELAYSYKTREEFAKGRQNILDSIPKSLNPDALKKHLSVGFGNMPDQSIGAQEFIPDYPEKNFFTAEHLQTSLYYALDTADRYAWMYTTRIGWWDGTANKEYVQALALAKKGPAKN